MPSYQTFTSARTTEPDPATLLANLRALDPTAGVQHGTGPTYVVKKATAWTAPQITAAQNAIDNATAASPQLAAQTEIDNWSITQKAFALALIDQLNVLRAFHSLAAITPAQAIAAVRQKAGTL